MDLVSEIRKLFAEVKDNNALSLMTLVTQYPAWVIRKNGWYGIGIPNISNQTISERFSSVRIWSQTMNIGGEEKNLLLLSSEIEYLRYEFAAVCAEFTDPGGDGELRRILTANPTQWWEKWRSLLGNSVQNKLAYSVLGEMLIYKHLLMNGEAAKWSAIEKSTHDIETNSRSYEVKSTIKRYESSVTINSQYQLKKPADGLYLCFCRFEESLAGKSIEDMANEIAALGDSYDQINIALEKMGFEKGSSARNKKYKLHEARKYEVNEKFPQITTDSFVDGKMPDGIVKLVYEVDLNGLNYSVIDNQL